MGKEQGYEFLYKNGFRPKILKCKVVVDAHHMKLVIKDHEVVVFNNAYLLDFVFKKAYNSPWIKSLSLGFPRFKKKWVDFGNTTYWTFPGGKW